MNQKKEERFIVISMSRFSFVFALDYLLSTIDVSTKAFTFPDEAPAVKSAEKLMNEILVAELKTKSSSADDKQVTNVIEFNLDKMEVIMLESLDVPNADACVFHCFSQIKLRLQPGIIAINGEVSKITMGLTNYLNYVDSGEMEAFIMSPTDLAITGTIRGTCWVANLAAVANHICFIALI